jgi:predicted acylesterase/phospholipase RssA
LRNLFGHHETAVEQADSSPSKVGLVLSGGGSRVSFQIGALRYLLTHEVDAFTDIAGTSGGSISGAMLSQFNDHEGQLAALDELDRVWMAMTSSSQMYNENAWFTELKGHASELLSLLTPGDEDRAASSAESPAEDRAASPDEQGVEPETGPQTLPLEVRDPEAVIQDALHHDPSEQVESGGGWSLASIGKLLAAAPKVARLVASLNGVLRGAEAAQSMFRPGNVVVQLLYKGSFDKALLPQSGVRYRVAFVDLNSGELRFLREDGTLVDRHDQPVLLPDGREQTYDMALGIMASCSIPGVFKPVKLGDGRYVDGGIREYAPVVMVAKYLRVPHPYAIFCSPDKLGMEDYGNKDMISSFMRSNSVQSMEVMHDEAQWALDHGAVVIQPRVGVHDSMTVDPGLLRINRDSGWMTAAQACRKAPDDVLRVCDDILYARLDCWAIENRILDAKHAQDTRPDHEPASGEGIDTLSGELVAAKYRLRDLLGRADPSYLPPGHEQWWQGYEAHTEILEPEPFWLAG